MNPGTAGCSACDKRLSLIAIGMLCAGTGMCLYRVVFPTARQRSLSEMRDAVESHRPEALALAQEYVEEFPSDPAGLLLAAKAAGWELKHELAMGFLNRLPADGGRWALEAHKGLAHRCEILGKVAAAERHLRRALELSPYDVEAHGLLGHLLQVEGRSSESTPHFFEMIRAGKCRGDELLGMSGSERFFRADERLESAILAADPPEVLLKLTHARRALFENRSNEAETLLRELLAIRPDLGEAQGRLGRLVVDRGDFAAFLRWRAGLPDGARQHPEVWLAQGLAARRQGQVEGAAACFLAALARSPNHLGANLQIAGCLEELGQPDAARAFSRRAALLAELESTLNLLRATVDAELMAKAIDLFGQMGRFWEAAGWSYVMTHLVPIPDGAEEAVSGWLRLARAEPGPDAPSQLPARLLDRRDFAEPRWPALLNAPQPPQSLAPVQRAWNFADDAERLGIRFEYFEGTTEENRLRHIFNVTGGGLAAFDYDGDGWTDLYLAQGNNWRAPEPQPEYGDRLFRNLQGERFADVTLPAELGDTGFSHGVTVGDFNQDAFPDIHVGNLGPNRLYRNNGDGTFADVSFTAGVAGDEWTTSSVFADFNDDGLPDLYVSNYTERAHTAAKECRRRNGERMACTPDLLISEPDRLYLNVGDGTFRDVSAESGILVEGGKGLGVVAWDFAGNGRLGIFVANDSTPNFLFVNDGPDARGVPRFREEGIVRGVALDADGNAQASMGVAAGDANGDGRIDLFLTTFFGESKTLYSQRGDGFFDDLTRALQLREPGFWMLGFGCQFADLDGDGWEDLIVTNGHVDQQSSRGDSDRMPPQLFHNQKGRRFHEVPRALLGPFFQRTYLGRGLAILDWNRDGRTDIAISHIHAPFALLTNQTPAVSRPLVVRLVGRSGCREPTGAMVRLETRSGEAVRLQTAGDGFLVTNERRLHFVVPAGEPTADLHVRWPGGATQTWRAVPAGCDVVLIEGRSDPVIVWTFPERGPNSP